MNITLLDQVALQDKWVFYRPDYNVPVQDGEILDDFRITATYPTLDYLIANKARIIIGSHLGRPDGKVDEQFSLRPVAEHLADKYRRQTIRLSKVMSGEELNHSMEAMKPGDMLLLPNLRFFPGEEGNDDTFAQDLASLAEFYVNDAFACDHRAHASIVGIPKYVPGCAGFLLQKEIVHLGHLLAEPESPFVVVMGGAKVSDKIEVIQALAKRADHILIGGAMANTFLLAQGEEVSESVVEKDKVSLAAKLLKELGDKLVIAADYVKEDEGEGKFKYLDIGPKAIEQFKGHLKGAKTIFWNGNLGYTEDTHFREATEEIAQYITGLKGVFSVVAGGDTVEVITQMKLHNKFSFVSTGGGAALEFLAKGRLPGVDVLIEK